jgi:hypothetical protein
MTTPYETHIPGAAVTAAPGPTPRPRPARRWPLIPIGAPAAVAVWSGWVGLGGLCGFGPVHPLPGIDDGLTVNTAITLPVGMEAYGTYALYAWLRPGTPAAARAFARRSAIGSLALGMAGQVIYHLLAAAHATRAPWPVVMFVSCLPVLAIGFGAALAHLLIHAGPAPVPPAPAIPVPAAGSVPGQPRTEPAPAPPRTPRPAPAARTDAARTDQDGDGAAPLAGEPRAAVVEMIAGQIRDAVEAGEVWRPDYEELMQLTDRRRSWCEKVVRDARNLVLTPPGEPGPAPEEATPGGDPGARTGDEGEPGPGESGDPYAGAALADPYPGADRTDDLALAAAP